MLYCRLQLFEHQDRLRLVMKKLVIISFFLTLFFALSVSAQTDPDDVSFEKLREADAKHNLNVAWQYFKLKKAYIAALLRTEETMAAHPAFSKMDEVLYVAGMSSYYLSIGKGKQKINLSTMTKEDREKYAAGKLKEDAVGYLGQLVELFPDSKYVSKAKETLKILVPEE